MLVVAFGQGTHEARWGDLGTNDTGAWYVETSRGGIASAAPAPTYRWSGTQWVYQGGEWQGTYEARWANLGAADAGALYVETTRGGIAPATPPPVYLWNGTQWVYQGGAWNRPQAALAALLATFGVSGSNDVGALVRVTDYAHVLQAYKPSAYAWQRGPGDAEHSDTFEWYGSAPADAGWHACDGSTVSFLQYNGTLGSRALPNTVGQPSYIRAGAAYAPSFVAAAFPIFTGNNQTFTTGSFSTGGNNTATALTGPASITPTGNISLAGGDPIPKVGLLLYYRQ